MDKIIHGAQEAIEGIRDGAVILIGGFGVCGIPENLLSALLKKRVKNLTLINNNAGTDECGIGPLIKAGLIDKMILSYAGQCKIIQEAALAGKLQIEWVPQGTLAERLRAGGAGLGGFFTPTGVGTEVAEGKESRLIEGKEYLFEKPLRGEYAFIKAWQGDRYGNLIYRKTARNLNPVMATAADRVIAEVELILTENCLDPDAIHTPGIYVDALFQGTHYDKPIEKRVVRKRTSANE